MKKLFNPFVIALVAVLFVSCTKPQQKMQAQISEFESELFKKSPVIADPVKADSMIAMYVHYADMFQADSLSPEYLFRAGDIANGTGKPKDALGYFGRVQTYPDYKKAGTALFLQGFISENSLNDVEGARRYYEKFLQKYPDHKMAADAKVSLENLGKTPDELIKEFEAKMNQRIDSLPQK